MLKQISKFIFLFIVAFCISQAGGWTSVFATEGARTYMGFSGITPTSAWPFEGGRGRDGTDNVTGAQGRYAWGVYNFASTQTDISYFGVQFNKYDSSNTNLGKSCVGLTTFNSDPGMDKFTLYKVDSLSTANLNKDLFDQSSTAFSAAIGTTIFPFGGPLYFANSTMDDGTCRYHAISNVSSGSYDPDSPTQPAFTIPSGNYLVVMSNGFSSTGVGFSGGSYHYSLNGDYTHGLTAKMIIPVSGTSFGASVNKKMVTADTNDAVVDNLNWYLGKSDTEIVPGGDPETFSCNPFVNDISTVFLNPAFSFLGCVKSAMTYVFAPSSESLDQFSTLNLSDREPFSYLYDIGNAYDELYSNSGSREYAVQATTTIGTFHFISASQINAIPYTSTIKTILGYLLWFFTGMFIYRIVLRVHE